MNVMQGIGHPHPQSDMQRSTQPDLEEKKTIVELLLLYFFEPPASSRNIHAGAEWLPPKGLCALVVQ